MRMKKKDRQEALCKEIEQRPFLTDEDLAGLFHVSIQTIRLDRMERGIPELREGIKKVAEGTQAKIKTIESSEIVGEIIDLELGKSGISIMTITRDMVYEKTQIARGHYVFSQANSLALALIDSPTAVTGVANIKYKAPIRIGQRLIAKAEIVRVRGNKFFVWVKTRNETQEVFRGKFVMVSLVE